MPIQARRRSIRAEDMKKDDIAAMTDEEIMAMEDEEIMAMDPEEVYAEEGGGGDSAAAIEDVVSIVDQRQAIVDEIAQLNQLLAEMDAALVPTVEEAASEPAIVENEPDPVAAEGTMDEEEVVQARRRAMRRMARRRAGGKGRRRAA